VDERVAIVTGAGSGIGRATARLLAACGQTVALVGRRREPLADVAAEIGSGPARGRALVVVADLAEPDGPRRIVEAVLAETARLDIVINNAASLLRKHLPDVTLDEFDAMLALNIRAPYFLVQAALPALRRSPAAVVVNVSSAAAAMYRPQQTVYGLTKAALEHMTMNLAAELAPERIRVACVRPGPVATAIYASTAGDSPDRLAELGRQVPLGRVGQPEEVARWIGHLVAPDAAWVTGAIIAVDGGRALGPPETG
jgi:meso-butanediol dehydrogenase / (S,S)-butanediol dehydrogenase / diacetyl reductase